MQYTKMFLQKSSTQMLLKVPPVQKIHRRFSNPCPNEYFEDLKHHQGIGSRGLSWMVSSKGMNVDAASSVAAEIMSVSGRKCSCGCGALVGGVLAGGNREGMGLRGPSPDVLSTSVYRGFPDQNGGGGGASTGPDGDGVVGRGRTHSPYRRLGDIGGAGSLGHL